jgi:hypothetical protein
VMLVISLRHSERRHRKRQHRGNSNHANQHAQSPFFESRKIRRSRDYQTIPCHISCRQSPGWRASKPAARGIEGLER